MTRQTILACAAAILGTVTAARPPAARTVVLISPIRILDVAAGHYSGSSAVVIENGRITSITPEAPASVPDTATRVKVDGGVLVPGLIDTHAFASPTADLDADYFYLMGLAHGVTAYRAINVRTTWGVSQRARARSGTTLAPRLWTSGRGIDQGASPDRWLFDASDAAAAGREAAAQVAAKVDWISGTDNLPADAYKAVKAAVKGTPVRIAGQPGASSMMDLVAAGVDSIETLAWPVAPKTGSADDAWLAATAKDLAALNARLLRGKVTLVPLLGAAMLRAFPDVVDADQSLALLPEARWAGLTDQIRALPAADAAKARRAWDSQAAFVKRFARAGGRVAAGTGFELAGYPVPGIGLHRELQALVRAGLTPVDALRAATTNGAALLNAGEELGRIAPGVEANLFIVRGDPLKNIGDLEKIAAVVRGGEVYDVKELLALISSSARRPPRPAS